MNINTKSLTIGGRTFDAAEIAAGVWLYGPVTTASRYSTVREYTNTAGYVVPGGVSLTIHAMIITSTAGSVLAGGIVGYGDNDIGIDAAAAPTNPVWIPSGASLNSFLGNVNTGGNFVQMAFPLKFVVPTGKYPAVRLSQANSNCILFGTTA